MFMYLHVTHSIICATTFYNHSRTAHLHLNIMYHIFTLAMHEMQLQSTVGSYGTEV